MYCYKCGKQIQDDSSFCSFCGIPQNSEDFSHYKPIMKNASNDYSSDALRVYFSNVLNLEIIIINLNKNIIAMEEEITFLQENNYFKTYNIGVVPQWTYIWPAKQKYVHFRFDGDNYYFLAKRNGDYLGTNDLCDNHVHRALLVAEDAELSNAFWLLFDKNKKYLSSLWEIGKQSFFSGNVTKYDENVEKLVYECFDDFKRCAADNFQKGLMNIENNNYNLSCMKKELAKAKELLDTAYNINIIPLQFRNVYAVYYLNNFIQTSNESLSTALLHFDLDEIKQKLDAVIEQQKEIIINQAIIQAQNQLVIEQNSNMLNSLATIESNTYMASQYAKIAANNAEACAWIGVANYIK